ncbi:MAG: hypothetical protein U1F87_06425 [Kiritimatiellia bacterium]
MKRFLLLLAAVFLACGTSCVSHTPSGYALVVANATPAVIRGVSVEFNGGQVCGLPELQPGAFSSPARMSVAHPQTATLRWSDAAGTARVATIRAQKALPANFAGKVFYDIQPDDSVKVFVEAAEASAQSDLPWNKPENWEGVPGIPGLTLPE